MSSIVKLEICIGIFCLLFILFSIKVELKKNLSLRVNLNLKMVCYCCVKGCGNNSNNKKKNPSSNTSFHAFPSNQELRMKWLKAIGRPNWDPPSHARICSAHFNYDQINHDSCRIRIKDDACPVNALPPNSNFEASFIEVCRICLATDLKMYSLENGILKSCMESIAGFNENYNIEGLPQFICFECAAHLIKCYNLIEKSMTAQATLLDIFALNGHITKTLIKTKNRENLNLKSNLKYNGVVPTYLFEYKYDDINETSLLTNTEFLVEDHKLNDCAAKTKSHVDNDLKKGMQYHNIENKINKTNDEYSIEDDFDGGDETQNYDSDNETIENIQVMNIKSSGGEELVANVLDTNEYTDKNIIQEKSFKRQQNKEEEKCNRKSLGGFTPNEVSMQKYFNIVKLTPQEQIEEWKKTMENRPWKSNAVYKCEVCSKIFAHVNTYRSHVTRHDPSRGKAECPVCKLRFKNDVVVRSHANRIHGKKFHCKSCSKVFSNVGVAKKHQKWHSGYKYACSRCPFRSVHESSLGVHVRRQHQHGLACARCGRAAASRRALRLHRAAAHAAPQKSEDSEAFPCEECNLSFNSEGARRVHILTSKQHRRKNNLHIPSPQDLVPKNTCKFCGVEFSTAAEVVRHIRTEHRRVQKKTGWRLPDDSYPTQCEHCDVCVDSRGEHWRHVRRHHPRLVAAYRRVVTAVCHACGKGFQNSTKLQLHALRHAGPTLRCSQCERMFYDKYALARHAAAHSAARPHACRTCGRAFKLRANLQRHARVHSGLTPYECTMCGKKFKYSTSVNLHVRTVHYKLPHPPRKKRTNKSAINIDDNNIVT
ncbi:zinc finger protein 490-like [Galleria mellonella]|uniref:Zinc finger protein 490-like n=1 Tax=Galleria mellonella TaxID=7137 RepID=A0A6J3C1P3_GALME|nr:zinc finger protein 490-like [Galleria mellonella]